MSAARSQRAALRWTAAALFIPWGCSSQPSDISSPNPNPPGSPFTYRPAPADASIQNVGPIDTSATFVRTSDSDEWVEKTLSINSSYERVFVVGDGPVPTEVMVRPLDIGSNPSGKKLALPVTAAMSTIQAAVDQSRGGDVIVVMPGRHKGFVIGERPNTGASKYVRITAADAPGAGVRGASGKRFAVVIDQAGPDDNWMAYFRGASYVILDGFALAGTSTPGHPAPNTPRAGVFIDGAFSETGRMAHHIVIANNYSHHHRTWGLHATDSHSVLLQGNVFGGSGQQHGAYISDGSDNYLIRDNVFFDNPQSGLQINLDPIASAEELSQHPAMGAAGAYTEDLGWLSRLDERALRIFGRSSYPDGRGENFIVERNVSNENGQKGAGAFNFACMSDSVIQDNLLYGNHAHGIAQWDDGNPFDEPRRQPGPVTATAARTVESLPSFGCRRNLIRNNTVIMKRAGRAAVQSTNGSYGTRVFNNILINDAGPAIEILNTAMYDFEARANVIGQLLLEPPADTLTAAAKALPGSDDGATGQTLISLAPHFVRATSRHGAPEAAWLTMEFDRFTLRPERPDFRPRPGAAIFSRADASMQSSHDLTGAPRQGTYVGALTP